MAWAVGSTLSLRAHDTCGNRLADIGFPFALVRLVDIADLAVAS